MNFWQKIRSSIYDPAFYRIIPKNSLGAALSYYFLFCLVATILMTLYLVFPISRGINALAQQGTQFILNSYPAQLQVQIQHGQLSTNVQQPYLIPICDNTRKCADIVIDTRPTPAKNYLQQENVVAFITKDTIFFKSNTNEIRGYNLKDMKDMTINKTVIIEQLNKFMPWMKFVIPAIIILAGIGIYIEYLFKLLYLFVLAGIFVLLAKKFTPGMTYRQAYKVGLHAITLGILVSLVLNATGWFLHIHAFPFLGTILAILVFIINYNTTPSVKVPSTKSTPRKNVKKK